MFKKKRKQSPEAQIPADLYATINEPQARRKRWVIEVLVSLVVVTSLLLAGMFLYNNVHHTDEPHSVPKSNAEHVTQPPQQKDSTGVPVPTSASDSTNDGSVAPPN